MKNEQIKNEKFIFHYSYDEKKNRFNNINFDKIKLNELENKILEEACLIFQECNPQELYEHLIIRIENRLRDFSLTKYKGVIFPKNISKEFKYFDDFFKKLLKPYIGNQLNSRINFQCIKPKDDWIFLSEEKKRKKILDILKKFVFPSSEPNTEVNIIRIENKIDIFLDLSKVNNINTKNKICLDLEIFLKRNIDESLNVYLETVVDKNKLRRLTL